MLCPFYFSFSSTLLLILPKININDFHQTMIIFDCFYLEVQETATGV